MSSRVLRRLKKEQEYSHELIGYGSDEEPQRAEAFEPNVTNTFNMLAEAEELDAKSQATESELEDEDGAKSLKNTSNMLDLSMPQQSGHRKKRKTKSKKKRKERDTDGHHDEHIAQTSSKAEDDLDEIDVALKSLSTKSAEGSYAISYEKPNTAYEEMCRLLRVESKYLNALNEMKRLFGNVVLEADNEEAVTVGAGRRRGRGPQELDLGGALAGRNSPVSRGQGLAGLALRRNVFIMGKEEWPKASSGGLSMEVVGNAKHGQIEYRFVHNTAYQDVQGQFESCVASLEPQRLIRMVQFNPYHISSLLQVSEIAKQQGDHSVSGDLLERALFSFGRSVHSSFSKALSEGKARLSFRRPENREFYLAVWRYITNLGQKGTWRTAYEWAKLLLSLDPVNDPYCVRLNLDQIALRCGQGEHLISLGRCTFLKDRWQHFPNITISCALAEYKAKQAAKSRVSLAKAVKAYPAIIFRLFQELKIDSIPKSIWGKDWRSEREKFEGQIYVHNAKDLWSTPEACSFLEEVSSSVTVKESPPENTEELTLDEARHALLSGVPALISLVPRKFTTMSSSASDPLPPPDNITSYHLTPARNDQSTYRDPFDQLDDSDEQPDPLLDIEQHTPTAGSLEPQASDMEEIRGLQSFFSRLIPWPWPRPASEGGLLPNSPEVQQVADSEAASANSADEILMTRGRRLMELLRRTLGRAPQEGDLPDLNPDDLTEALGPTSPDRRPNDPDDPPLPSPSPSPSRTDSPSLDDPGSASYSDDRNQHWLAGAGMVGLRAFADQHGTNPSAWSASGGPATVTEGQRLVAEYVARIRMLRSEQSRRFILDYALRQGAGSAVGDLVRKTLTEEGP